MPDGWAVGIAADNHLAIIVRPRFNLAIGLGGHLVDHHLA